VLRGEPNLDLATTLGYDLGYAPQRAVVLQVDQVSEDSGDPGLVFCFYV
jgi:hypothetical protein